MRKVFLGAVGLVFLTLIALSISGSLVAQQNGMRMQIPVPFLAGNTDFPAGEYIVRVDERFHVLEVDGQSVRAKMMLATKSMKRTPQNSEKASLRLQKYGETYVLRSVFQREDAEGWALVRSQRENQLAKAHPATETRLIAENSN